jgi:hypothetical protein
MRGRMGGMKITKLELGFLCLNLIVLGGALVLMLLRGPNTPLVLLTIGTLGMAIAKIGKAYSVSQFPPK